MVTRFASTSEAQRRPFVLEILLLTILLSAACSSPPPIGGHAMAEHFHYRPATDSAGTAVGWAVLLPGASGLRVFDDDSHYFRVADLLNRSGIDVVVVDYKAAYKAAKSPPRGPTGEKICWVTERAIEWMRTQGYARTGSDGAIVAWSKGAEALWRLLPDGARTEAAGLRCAAVYYPTNDDDLMLRTSIPLLIQSGESDNVTPAKSILAMARSRPATDADVKLDLYPNAHHGFDVSSLDPSRTVRLIPLLGPEGTFAYDPKAAEKSQERLVGFLLRHLAEHGR